MYKSSEIKNGVKINYIYPPGTSTIVEVFDRIDNSDGLPSKSYIYRDMIKDFDRLTKVIDLSSKTNDAFNVRFKSLPERKRKILNKYPSFKNTLSKFIR